MATPFSIMLYPTATWHDTRLVLHHIEYTLDLPTVIHGVTRWDVGQPGMLLHIPSWYTHSEVYHDVMWNSMMVECP